MRCTIASGTLASGPDDRGRRDRLARVGELPLERGGAPGGGTELTLERREPRLRDPAAAGRQEDDRRGQQPRDDCTGASLRSGGARLLVHDLAGRHRPADLAAQGLVGLHVREALVALEHVLLERVALGGVTRPVR